MADTFGNQGAQDPQSDQGEYNTFAFLIAQAIARLSTSGIVKIIAVDDPGGVALAGRVDVQPMVNQLDGSLVQWPHGIIYSLPYFRLQGGASAIVITPTVGDIGVALYADRDISTVKATRDFGPPGSLRRFDMADGMYFGGILNAAPTQYILLNADGITLTSPTGVIINAESTINGNTDINGDTVIDGDGETTGTFKAGNGATGTFMSKENKVIVVEDGIVTSITP